MPPAPSAPPAPIAPPAPAGAAPGPVVPPTPPTPAPVQRAEGHSSDFESQLNASFDRHAPMDPKPEAKPVAPPAPAPKALEKPTVPKEEPKAPEPSAKPTPPRDPKELRQELAARTKQIAEYEERLKVAESKGKDTEALATRIAELEKERDEAKGELRRTRFEASPEFKAKHEVPFQKEAARVQRIVEQLQVMDPDTRQARPATFADFKKLYALSHGEAFQHASENFGNMGPMVYNHYERLKALEEAATEALTEEKNNWENNQKSEAGRKAQRTIEMSKLDQKVRQELAENTEEYHDNPTDADLIAARNSGYAEFDQKPQTWEEVILRKNHLRHRFAAFEPMKLRITRLAQQLAEAQKELATYKNEPPDPNRRSGGREAGGKDSLTWEQAAIKELT